MNLKQIATSIFFMILGSTVYAQTVLTVAGAPSSGESMSIEYSMDDLDKLDQVELTTTNEFVDSETQFSGPLVRDLVEGFTVTDDTTLTLRAINNYEVSMPIADVLKYDVIVATKRDGNQMSVRENGPLWIIYPMSDNPELQNSLYMSRLVWQLVHISVE